MGYRYEKRQRAAQENKKVSEQIKFEKELLSKEFIPLNELIGIQDLLDDDVSNVINSVTDVKTVENERLNVESDRNEADKKGIVSEIDQEMEKLESGLKRFEQLQTFEFGKAETQKGISEYRKQIEQYKALKAELLTASELEGSSGVEKVAANHMDLIEPILDGTKEKTDMTEHKAESITMPIDSRETEYVEVPYSYQENGRWEHSTYSLPIRYDDVDVQYSECAISFKSDSDMAEEWAKTEYTEWRENLNNDTVESMKIYSGPQYRQINEANRGDMTQMTPGIENITRHIDNGINNANLPSDTVVYRAINEGGIVDMVLQAGGELQSGIVLQDMGYMSTSMTTDTSFMRSPQNNYLMRLTAVEGLHGAPLLYGDLSYVPNESEMLFGRGHSIYVNKVSKIRRSDIVPGGNDDFVTLIDGILTI